MFVWYPSLIYNPFTDAVVWVQLVFVFQNIIMKKTILAILCLALSTLLFAQKTKPTAAAEKAFRQKFPDAKNVTWGKEGRYVYEAAFIMDGKKGSANFYGTGEWMETEMAIPQAAAPKAVVDQFMKNFPGATINEVYRIETNKKKDYYEIEYNLKGRKKEARITADGKLM